MKRFLNLGLIALLSLMVVTLAFAGASRLDLKVGEEIYACNSREGGSCQTLSRAPGKCVCGIILVKAKVVKVEKGVAYLQAKGWKNPRPFKTVGKYTCDCGPNCKCIKISQQPGRCPCGKPMKAVR